jgi:hypothetical protein
MGKRGPKVGTIKYGGRKKGTPNKSTAAIEEKLAAAGIDVIERLAIILNMKGRKAPGPLDQAFILLRLMKFIYPERKAIDLDVPDEVKDVIYKCQWGDSTSTA